MINAVNLTLLCIIYFMPIFTCLVQFANYMLVKSVLPHSHRNATGM